MDLIPTLITQSLTLLLLFSVRLSPFVERSPFAEKLSCKDKQ